MTDIWDDPDMITPSNFVKFETIGDKVVGEVLAVQRAQDFNGQPCPQLIIRTDEGEERTVTAGQAQLRAKLADPEHGRPRPGDRIAIVFSRTEKVDKGTLKCFDVQVKRGGPVAAAAAGESNGGLSAADLL